MSYNLYFKDNVAVREPDDDHEDKPTSGASNDNLSKARSVKQDEFYTRMETVKNELDHHREWFKNKNVYCNCDDPKYSNFWKYFFTNFVELGLNRLVSTYFKAGSKSSKTVVELSETGQLDSITTPLRQCGDFRDLECVEELKKCDIVVTNPPFSLFNELYKLLIRYNKDYLIVGGINTVAYTRVIHEIVNNRARIGRTGMFSTEFRIPNSAPDSNANTEYKAVPITWLTTLPVKEPPPLMMTKHYNGNEAAYPHYDNFDAIHIERTSDVPCDYYGIMGVPITFLHKRNSSQFEVLGTADNERYVKYTKRYTCCYRVDSNGKKSRTNITSGCIVASERSKSRVYYTAANTDGFLWMPFTRLFVRRIE